MGDTLNKKSKIVQRALEQVRVLEIKSQKMNPEKQKALIEQAQELQIDFTGKLHNKPLNGEVQILIAIDRFS